MCCYKIRRRDLSQLIPKLADNQGREAEIGVEMASTMRRRELVATSWTSRGEETMVCAAQELNELQ